MPDRTPQADHEAEVIQVPLVRPVADAPIELAEVKEQSHFAEAAAQLQKVVDANAKDPEIHYLLAMAYKRQKMWKEARAALRKIEKPDGNVLMQMGILSLAEKNLPQAEGDFVRALQLSPDLFAAGYNLLLTRLSLGNISGALAVVPGLSSSAPAKSSARLLTFLQGLLQLCDQPDAKNRPGVERSKIQQLFEQANENDEKLILRLIRSLGHVDVTYILLKCLVSVRPYSELIREGYFEGCLLKARNLMQRCHWNEAQSVLSALVHQKRVGHKHLAALHNLIGCCACVIQDFDKAVHHYQQALKHEPDDVRIHQNLALTLEMTSKLTQASKHWDEVFDILEHQDMLAPPATENYREAFEVESLSRLANEFADKARWTTVLNYLHRAQRIRPRDVDLMERLFHIYQQAEQMGNARKMLDRLRSLRPNDPQLDLYELDLVDVKSLADIEYLLSEIEDILSRYPNDHRVEERAVNMVGNVVPLMGNLCDQLTDQLNKVYKQVRNLPRYQIDWNALNEIMRDLSREFRKLKRITGKCMPLVTHDEHKRIIRELQDHIEEKIEACRSLMD